MIKIVDSSTGEIIATYMSDNEASDKLGVPLKQIERINTYKSAKDGSNLKILFI